MVAKRVILRLREGDFSNMLYSDIVPCVKRYLEFSGRAVEEAEQNKHFWHFQPPHADPPQANPRFHIIIDIDDAEHSGPLQKDFPHEIYRVAKVENQM